MCVCETNIEEISLFGSRVSWEDTTKPLHLVAWLESRVPTQVALLGLCCPPACDGQGLWPLAPLRPEQAQKWGCWLSRCCSVCTKELGKFLVNLL